MDLVVYHGDAQVGVVEVEVEGDAPHDDQPDGQLHYLETRSCQEMFYLSFHSI